MEQTIEKPNARETIQSTIAQIKFYVDRGMTEDAERLSAVLDTLINAEGMGY